MLRMLSRNWWYFILRGLIAVIFGVLALVYPLATVATLVILFGIFALADGIFNVIASIASAGYFASSSRSVTTLIALP